MKYYTITLFLLCFSCNSNSQTSKSKKIDSLTKLAIVADSLQDLPASIKYYTEILKLDSVNLMALNNRGRALVWLGEIDSGFEDYDKVVKLYPHERSYYTRGMAYLSILSYDKALADLKKSIELNQNYKEPFYGLALIYANQNNLDSALLLCNKADKISYQPDLSHFIRFTIFQKKGDSKAVIAELNECIKIDPANAMHYNNRGLAKNQLKQYKEAIIDFNMAIQLDSKMAFAYNNKAFSLLRLSQLDEALATVNRSLELDSNNPYALRNRGEIFFALSSKDKACDDLIKANDLSTDKDLTQEIRLLINRVCKK